MKSWKLTGEKIVNLFLLLLSIFYLSYSLLHYQIGSARMPKEGFMPMLLGIGMVGLSGFLTIQAFMGKGDAQKVRFPISWLRFFGLIGVSLLYALLLEPIGYLIATFAFLLCVLKIAKVDGWGKPLLIAGITSVAFYLIFKTALGVMLPTGLIHL